jgi:uncharacterized protein (DUF1697 family)
MAVFVSFLRGVNLGGRTIKMDVLRALYESLGLKNVQTYIASGNVVFTTTARDVQRLSKRIEEAIKKQFGFQVNVLLRTPAELRECIANNPFAARENIEPGKLLVTFLGAEPTKDAQTKLETANVAPDEVHIVGREMFIYFPNGQGRATLKWTLVDKTLGTANSGRNMNTVTKLLEIAESLERG